MARPRKLLPENHTDYGLDNEDRLAGLEVRLEYLEGRVAQLYRLQYDPLALFEDKPGCRRDGRVVTISPRAAGFVSQEETTADTDVLSPAMKIPKPVRIRTIRERG